jgi:FecR protein
MKNLRKPLFSGSAGTLLLAALFSAPTWAQTQAAPTEQQPPQAQQQQEPYPQQQNPPEAPKENALPPRPGAINYVEGKATFDGQALNPNSVGSIDMDRGQTITTQAGKVEVLLTPGVFLRLGDNSTVKMISPDLANTEVAMTHGTAMVEVTDIHKENNIRVDVGDASVKLRDKGLYEFDADRGQVRVFKGKADVFVNGQKITLGDHHFLALNNDGEKLKGHDFDTKQYADSDLYRWSGLRSGYLAEAGADQARLYVNGGPGWVGTGWYWDPWFSSYTFIPGDGIFYSPFGWGFYSPYAVWGSPFFYGGYGFYGGRYYPGRYYHHFGEMHGPYGHGFEPHGGFRGGFRGGMAGGGFHGGMAGGGGFHGGGGGPHH